MTGAATIELVASIFAVIAGLVAGALFVARVLGRLNAILALLHTVHTVVAQVELLAAAFEMLKAWKVETDLRLLRIETHVGLIPLANPAEAATTATVTTTATTVRTTP